MDLAHPITMWSNWEYSWIGHTVPEGSSKEKECSIIFLTSSPSCFLDDLECSFWRNNLQYLDLCFSGLSSFSHLAPWNSNLHPLHLVTLNMGWGTTSQSVTLNSVSSSLAFLFSARIWSHCHHPGMCRCFLYMHISSISEAQYHRNYMNLIPRWPGFLALAGGANIYSQIGQNSDGKVMTDQRCSSITRQYMSNTGFFFESVTIKNRAFFRWLRCVPWILSILLEMQFLRYISSLQLYYTIEASTIDRQISTDCACRENARKEFWLSIEGWRTLRWKEYVQMQIKLKLMVLYYQRVGNITPWVILCSNSFRVWWYLCQPTQRSQAPIVTIQRYLSYVHRNCKRGDFVLCRDAPKLHCGVTSFKLYEWLVVGGPEEEEEYP
jgi:hypothetical protein